MATGQNVGAIYYEVEADTSKLVNSSSDVDSSLNRLNRQFDRTDRAAASAQFQMTKTAQAVKNLGRESSAAASQMSSLAKMVTGLITLQGARGLIEMAEAYGEMAERVQMATSSAEEYERVQARLLETANRTYRSLAEAQETFILTADSVRSLGYDTDQALDIVDSLSYAFVKNATSTQRADGAISAFTKALNKGKVEADGWETLIAAVPSIISDIAAAAGLTTQQVREMGVSGEIAARMLTEGLRRSRDENKAAADGMATTLKDAFRNLSNNLSVYIGEANRASGATGLLSSAIIGLGDNIDTIVKLLMVAGAGALAKYISGLTASALASAKAAVQARIHAAEQLRLAVAEERAAAAAVAQSAATARMGGSQTAAAAATARLTAAQTALAASQRAFLAAGGGLLTLLGGPAGIIALVASAAAGFVLFGDNARGAVPDVNALTDAIDKLGEAQLRLRRQQAEEAIERVQRQAQDASSVLRGMERDYNALSQQLGRGVDAAGLQNATRSIVEQRAEVEQYGEQLNTAREALRKINEEIDRRSTRAPAGGGAPAGVERDPEVQKRLQALRDERELANLTGEARARLQAIQQLGAKATEEERQEAARLAAEIYRLENGRKAGTKATKESTKAQDENAKVIADLAQSLFEAGLAGEQLAVYRAHASLNKFATPEEVAQVQALAKALYEAEQAKAQRAKFGSTGREADQYIMGDVAPLTGGAFDDQVARYEAEAKLEQERYAAQLERLEAARQLQIETAKSYDQLEEEAARQHADRMAQIEQAKNSVILSSASDAFGAMADILRESKGEQSGIYRAMFAASKAFAIADATINAYSAISKAWASAPFPANLAAVASTTPQVMAVVSAISGASYSGRQYGGGVGAGKMYRVNENGAPEILNTASGRQYLLPNTRGEVVSNKDATAGRQAQGARVTVIVNQAPPNTTVEHQIGPAGEDVIAITVGDLRTGGQLSQAIEGTYGLRRRGN